MEIKNTAAIITGGASGMGAATAKWLAKLGAKVALLDMNVAEAQKLANEVSGIAVECDVTNPESVAKALATAEAKHGAARICINCAGIVHGKRMVGKDGPMPLAEFNRVIQINLIGTFNVMSLAAAKMIPLPLIGEERGIIINVASVAAYEGQIGQTAYSASKGGIVAIGLPAARELAQFAIRVNTIAPGLVDTPMFSKITPEARESLYASVPFPHRLAKPEEFAHLAQHIIENPMINGEVIRLDGALRMAPR